MKKVIKLTESDLIRLIKRVVNEQNAVSMITSAPQSTTQQQYAPKSTSTQSSDSPVSNMGKVLTQLVGYGRGVNYEKICQFCKTQTLDINNPRAKQAAKGFSSAITGGENPFSNFGGYENKNSSAYKAGMAIQNNLQTAEDICTMIKYYKNYSGSGEEMVDAISGELNYKVDSSTNLELMFGWPLAKVLGQGPGIN